MKPIIVPPNTVVKVPAPVPLYSGAYALVDAEDLKLVGQYHWYINEGYAVTYHKGKRIKMHRLIMNAAPSQAVDHRDKNKLNNQKSNLRFATTKENNRNGVLRKDNTSGYKGVSIDPSTGHWRPAVYVDGKSLYFGSYKDKHHAALAYDLWAVDLHGEFASTNFPVVSAS
jgi:hypothetical protein